MLQKLHTPNAPEAIGPYSQAVIVEGMLYTSGQIAIDPATGEVSAQTIETQTEQICQNLKAILDEAGAGFDHVVKTTCFLSDMANFAAFNAVYAKYFTGKPARSCVEVSALPKGVLAEVELIARL